MSFLPQFLMRLFQKKKGGKKGIFAVEVDELRLSVQDTEREWELDQVQEPTPRQDFEIFPADVNVRNQWFSLTIRERQVCALVCMGYKNGEIAAILGVEYATVQTHLQKIFRKFNLRSRKEIRSALASWLAEEWWQIHHY